MSDAPQPTASTLFTDLLAELERLAHRLLAGERAGHTLETGALVNQAYLRLRAQPAYLELTPREFLALASTAMRRILISHARARDAAKRGAGKRPLPLPPEVAQGHVDPDLILDVDAALEEWASRGENAARQVRVFEHHVFGGLPHDVIASLLGRGVTSVRDDWRLVRAHVIRRLTRG